MLLEPGTFSDTYEILASSLLSDSSITENIYAVRVVNTIITEYDLYSCRLLRCSMGMARDEPTADVME